MELGIENTEKLRKTDERPRTAAERIAMLDLEKVDTRDTLWDSRERLTALEIRKAHEETLQLTQGERDGVYEAVIQLVETRLKEAKT